MSLLEDLQTTLPELDIPVETGIIFASCNELQGTALGIFIVEAIGRDEDIAAVRKYIVAHNVQVQEVVL